MAAKQKAPDLTSGLVFRKGAATPAPDMVPEVAPPAPEAAEPGLPLVEAVEVTPEPPAAELPAEPIAAEPAEPEVDRNDAPLNFRVSLAFRREFKTYAAQHDLKLNELLRLAFDAYKLNAS